jgi:hypothetical protein
VGKDFILSLPGVSILDVEHIHTKIAELETKIADFRVAEREILALDQVSAPPARTASEPKLNKNQVGGIPRFSSGDGRQDSCC